MKYPIRKEFFPFSLLAPPIRNAKVAGWMGSKMKPPRWVHKNLDAEVSVQKESVPSDDGSPIEVYVISPTGLNKPLPCLVYYHGGGFFFEGAGYHYRLAKQYALEVGCYVAFVQYRLAPKHPHPTPAEDCYAALQWIYKNAERLKIYHNRIAVGGDSAGGTLAAAVCQMARDRNTDQPIFQLLVYPVTDRRMDTASNRKFTDTPMWNSKLSKLMWQGYLPQESPPSLSYASPMEATSFKELPPAYVEVAEFDCLHDEGLAYANALEAAGGKVERNELAGTMHGFDIVERAPTTQAAVAQRIAYMKQKFYSGVTER